MEEFLCRFVFRQGLCMDLIVVIEEDYIASFFLNK